jgi:Glycosyl transferase family 90
MSFPHFDKDFRIRYYLGELSFYYMEHKDNPNPPVRYECTKEFHPKKEIPDVKECVTNYKHLKEQSHSNRRLQVYCNEMSSFLSLVDETKRNKNIMVKLGDNRSVPSFFAFAKTRMIYCRNIILLNLNFNRHWGDIPNVRKYDIPFHQKKNAVVWRGSSTGGKGNTSRDQLVRKYQHHPNKALNIKYSNLVQGYQNTNNQYILQPMSMEDQLKHKFIISIEGNDVATNLKWLMYSNSVVFMPKPIVASWFMEDQLLPYVHYIELKDDFSDIEEKYNWCMQHLNECEQIAKEATKYVEQFLDRNKEKEITKAVIETYLNATAIHSQSI